MVRHGPLWLLRDTLPQPGKARTEESFASGAPPADVVRALHNYAPRGQYVLVPFLVPDVDVAEAKAAYKALGFRLRRSEPLFVCPLVNRDPVTSTWQIRRVASLEQTRLVCLHVYGKPSRKVRPEDLTTPTPPIRMYWVDGDGEAVAVARSLIQQRTATWMHDVMTIPEFRHRGIATALLRPVLADDARLGSEHAILLASQAGSKLYPHLGYHQTALLQVYDPARLR